tara:strand:+ start:11306 stop:12103 length:798 start_codon:yes stop_codon:yes gene_type:complete
MFTRKFNTLDDFETFDILFDKVKNYKDGDKLYFTRFGDGCFIMLYPESPGQTIGSSNQFVVTDKLQHELRTAYNIEDDSYMVAGCFDLNSQFSTDSNIRREKVWNMVSTGQIVERYDFYSATAPEANFMFKPQLFRDFCNLIYDRKKVWINQFWHDNVGKIWGNIEHHIQTPSVNSYGNIDEWWPELLEVLDDVDVVICASGQSSRVICGRLWSMGVKKIVLDIGSVADMFVANTWIFNNIKLRSTMHKERSRILNSLEFMLEGR